MSAFEVNATIVGHSRIDFDKRKVRRVLSKEGTQVKREAKRLLARRAISGAGDIPGMQSGLLRQSVTVTAGSGGFWVKVEPYKKGLMPFWYPIVLAKGSAKRGIDKRADYMHMALEARRSAARAAITSALPTALIPR